MRTKSGKAFSPEFQALNIIVFDFDGVLAEETWPNPAIGLPIEQGLLLLEDYSHQGYGIIIHTARPASHAQAIWTWLQAQHVKHLVHDVVTGKPWANLYIDDRGFRFERDV
jgi:hypothetical protein